MIFRLLAAVYETCPILVLLCKDPNISIKFLF
jgi:hypothetical protein